jgi:serine/threonine protein kinase/tetratricopeptide (TPR) repeat protein
MVTTGQTVSHYRVLEELGGGGMGVVYRAHDERLDRDVALKVLPAGLLADETARSRFRREAVTLSQLSHPNIAVIHDFDSEGGVDFLTMEYVAGETLAAKTATGPLPEKDVIALGTQIAEALEEAHEHQVIHRDLKPANVMVTVKGRVKVLDFGLAKLVKPVEAEADAATASLAESQPGVVMGTVPYMAPEQLQGKAVDARADIYGLGAILYEMATGQRPFPEKQSTPLIASILTEPPQPPRELNGQVSPDLEAIILKALAKNPDERYPSAKEVLGDLGRLGVPRSAVGAQGPKIQSIAVLPLTNLSGDPQQDFFADGMTEELITSLAKIGALKVISRTSAMQYKGTRKSLPQIAKELKVDALIEGSVLREGGQVRITAQLIEASTDQHLWAESYQRELRGVLALQAEIAGVIAEKVCVVLTPTERARLASVRTVNPETYEAYLKAKFYLYKKTPEGFAKGVAMLQQAIEKDPTDPLPYAGLALAYPIIYHGPGGTIPPKDGFPRAHAAALKAVELDKNSAEAHLSLAAIKLYFEWDWTGAEKEFRRALELNLNLPDAHAHYGWYLSLFGKNDEGMAEEKRSAELDPLSPIYTAWIGWYYFLLGEFDKAIAEVRKALEMDPNLPDALFVLGAASGAKGMFEQGIVASQKLAAVNADWKFAPAYVHALTGHKDDAQKILAALEREDYAKFAVWIADIQALPALRDKEETLRALEAAYEYRHIFVPWIVQHASSLCHSDARYQNLLRRVGFAP